MDTTAASARTYSRTPAAHPCHTLGCRHLLICTFADLLITWGFAMPHYIIRRIRLAHCKRGPAVCEQCRALDVEKYCLLDVDPPQPGLVQRRVIQVTLDGEPAWREFDVVRAFDSRDEAAAYAAAAGLELEAESPPVAPADG